MMIGGCFCGQVRYEIHGMPFHATICHCADCRRVTAAPFVAWFSVAPSELRFVAGTPKRFASSAQVTRSFCPDCGTPLTYRHGDLSAEIDVATCSLDDPGLVPPRDHVQAGRKLPWVHVADGLTQHAGTRTDG